MSARKKNGPKANALSLRDRGSFQMLTACGTWDEAEWDRLRELWKIHGERLIQENIENGKAPPMFLAYVDPERDEQLTEEWRSK